MLVAWKTFQDNWNASKKSDDIIKGIDHLLSEYDTLGIKNLKFGSGYYRELNYRNRTKEEAQAAFNRIMNLRPDLHESSKLFDTDQIILDDYGAIHIIS